MSSSVRHTSQFGGFLRHLLRTIRDYERSQFGQPRGLVGSLAGMVMAYENRARNAWAVALLDVQPTDRVLEIGFGPGIAVQMVARLAARGFVAGVDHSTVMVAQARRRNRVAIAQGRVDLRHGVSTSLPYPDASFDKVLAVNAAHFWADAARDLAEVRRVLRPGGLVAIIVQPVWAKTDEAARALGADLARQLATAGFRDIRVDLKPMRPVASVGVRGAKVTAEQVAATSRQAEAL